MENIHSLNRELISLLERSQMETASLRPGKKNFGSGQLIFENWSGGPVDLFLKPDKSSKSYFSTSLKT